MSYYYSEKKTIKRIGFFSKKTKQIRLIEVSLITIFLISGCTLTVGTKYPEKKSQTKISQTSGVWHTVKKGENLYRISLYYEVSRDEIKKANNMESDNIFVGQKLFIPGTSKKTPLFPLTPETMQPEKETKPQEPEPETKPETIIKEKNFIWPVEGKIICNYGELGNKGIDILTKAQSSVKAAKEGKIVYVGTTAKYGETIIIEHENEVFTVYGHDMIAKVKQGQTVKKGFVIAEMKNSGQNRRYLHFEIRIKNNPVNPLNYLDNEK